MIHKVDACGVCETHFPSAGKRSKLRDWLLLDRAISSSVLTVHSYVLLPSRVNPSSGSRVMVHEVGTSFRRVTLLPSSRKFACPGGSSTGGDHLSSAGIVGRGRCSWGVGRRRSLSSVGKCRRVGTGAVLRQHTVLMSGAFRIGLLLQLGTLFSSIVVCCWAYPRCLP
jgi:hypothetical protein